MANTINYITQYEDILQSRLDHPTTWKEMCEVAHSDDRTISSSYWSVTPSVQSVTRGTAFSNQDFSEVADTLTISTGRDLPVYLDMADAAQSPWTKEAEIFDRIGALLNEFIEANVLAQFASWTSFNNSNIGGAAGNITVDASTIDDVIRGVKQQVRTNNGQFLMNQNGVGFIWRATDFNYLEAFAQANGFMSADRALDEGVVEGFHYFGADHYWSNDHTAGHVFAGVKKVQRLGILRATYGKAHIIEFPVGTVTGSTEGNLSGKTYYSRVDIGHLTPTAHKGLVFNVLVN